MSLRLGIVSDAHGNIAALRMCLRFLRSRRVDRIVFLGDAIGYMPFGAAVCRSLDRLGALCLMGNHEAMHLGLLPLEQDKNEVYRLDAFARGIPARWLKRVERTGASSAMEIEGKRLLLVHGTPRDPLRGYGNDDADLLQQAGDAHCVVSGHTHRPHCRDAGRTLLLNPGSCGMPRDRGDLLSCAVLEVPSMRAEIHRLPFTYSHRLQSKVHPLVARCFARRNGPVAGHIEEDCP